MALEVGDELCRCRFSEELPEAAATIQLAKRIKLPLVAGLLRQCTESLRTNLYIKVVCGNRLLRESSESVTVLPADEWRDDGEDHRWLPSFVLPRDPAVLKVIDAAQRYLRTLLDDCSAGFDGYQQLLSDDSNAADVVTGHMHAAPGFGMIAAAGSLAAGALVALLFGLMQVIAPRIGQGAAVTLVVLAAIAISALLGWVGTRRIRDAFKRPEDR